MHLRPIAIILLVLPFITARPAPLAADEIDVIGTHRDWTAYETTQGGSKLCYMASEPKKDEGDYTKRGRIYAMVSHRPEDDEIDVVSIHAGYNFKEDSTVEVDIGGKSFTLFTHGDTAWAFDQSDDRALVKAMKAGRTMIVRGVSWRGTKTKDTYSLLGFTAAYNGIAKACGLD